MKRGYDKLIFCGIGGSAVVGEFIKSIDLGVPVLIARERLPDCADRKTLCFIVSYSGNTKETVDLYKQAKKRKCQIIIVTSGGRLSRLKEKILLVPKGFMPREAFLHMIFPVLDILGVKHDDYADLVDEVDSREVDRIVKKISGKVPVIYSSSERFMFLSYRWQTFFNENAKIFAHSNYFPELAHNEIEAKSNKVLQPILLVDKKTKVIKKAEKIIKPVEVLLKGKDFLSKMLYGIYFGYVVSYRLAQVSRTNARATKRIDELKK
jgi:glucose/mannose-6-phosphate isomerase